MPALCRIATVVLLLAACSRQAGLSPPSGDIASGLALSTLDDVPFDPGTLRDKPAIVMFWSATCGHCRKELPIVDKVAKARGATAVAVLVAGRKDEARQVAGDFGGVLLLDDGSLRERLAITAVPYTLVLRGDGTASHAFRGEQGESTLDAAVRSAK